MAPQVQILLVELKRREPRSFARDLRDKGYDVATAKTGRQAREILASYRPDVIVMDTTDYPSSGVFVCHMLRTLTSGTPLIYVRAAGRQPPLSIRADIYLEQPFTTRKLVNRINRLLPSVDGPTFRAGPLTLSVDKRSLHRNNREHRLTPKQAHLLEVLMRHSGRVISRRELMKRVWDTDFMDDTRTLDVHIRWVREAVESNPSRPRYIRTVRGRGYQFAIPPEEAPPPR
jgi:DNA-binding response OmpR family regulator